MRFIDLAHIHIAAGHGGDGALSFRREKFIPKGGPDGADGGKGGDVVFEAVPGILTLADFQYKRKFQAERAEGGRGSMKIGKNGSDIIIHVPCGTVITDAESGDFLADLTEPGERFVAAHGGRGGKGNAHFASSVRRAPRFAQKGDAGEERDLTLELKLIADVGLVGLPNAGKSSLLDAISNAHPKIAGYPFTTLSPNLGALSVDDQQVIVADVPGLVEGAHENKGLGHYFLRHVERTRILVHVIDVADETIEPLRALEILRDEFAAYSLSLTSRPYIIVANKIDIEGAKERASGLKGAMLTSALSGEGIDELILKIVELVREHPRVPHKPRIADEAVKIVKKREGRIKPVEIVELSRDGGGWRVVHDNLETSVARLDFGQDDTFMKFTQILKKLKVEEALELAGAQDGDKVYIGDVEFDYQK